LFSDLETNESELPKHLKQASVESRNVTMPAKLPCLPLAPVTPSERTSASTSTTQALPAVHTPSATARWAPVDDALRLPRSQDDMEMESNRLAKLFEGY
jgi:hypothetical protein